MGNQIDAAAQLAKAVEAFLRTQSTGTRTGMNNDVQSNPKAAVPGAGDVMDDVSRDNEERGSDGRRGPREEETTKALSRSGENFLCGDEDEAKVADLARLLQDDVESQNFLKETR